MQSTSADAAAQRLPIVEALIVAIERRHELLDAIAHAQDADVAQAAVMRLLDVDAGIATSVLGLRFQHCTAAELTDLRSQADSLRARISAG